MSDSGAKKDLTDPTDLGLWVTPFEQAYDRSAAVALSLDEEPFDPEIEATRAAEIAYTTPQRHIIDDVPYWRFRRPLFDSLPSAERAAWWRDFFDAADREWEKVAPKLIHRDRHIIDKPDWLAAALVEHPTGEPKKMLDEVAIGHYAIREHDGGNNLGFLALRPVLQRLPESKRDEVLAELADPIPAPVSDQVWRSFRKHSDQAFRAAALGGRGEQIAAAIAQVPPPKQDDSWYRITDVVLLAETPGQRVGLANKVHCRLATPSDVLAWIVATKNEGFDYLIRQLRSRSRAEAEDLLLDAETALQGPGAVGLFVELLDHASGTSDRWLAAHPAQVLAAELSDGQATTITSYLRELSTEKLQSARPDAFPAIRRVIDQVLGERELPDFEPATPWWQSVAADVKPASRTQRGKFLRQAMLPPILVADSTSASGASQRRNHKTKKPEVRQLAEVEVGKVLAALAKGDIGHPLLAALREHGDPVSLDRFTIGLLDQWLVAEGPTKQRWMMVTAAFLGGDRLLTRLAPLLNRWPSESLHQRAVAGLTALQNLGSDNALHLLSSITLNRHKALRRQAAKSISAVAEARGLAADELADRIVPDLDLDDQGSRTFDFGARQFRLSITSEAGLTLRELRDGQPVGQPLNELPSPESPDDQQLAAAALEEFAIVQNDLAILMKTQVSRFEKAMKQRRRWSPQDHHRFIATHPLLRPLLAGVVWGIFDDKTLLATGRIDETGDLLDVGDQVLAPEASQLVGVVRARELGAELRDQWQRVLADFELMTPFDQFTKR